MDKEKIIEKLNYRIKDCNNEFNKAYEGKTDKLLMHTNSDKWTAVYRCAKLAFAEARYLVEEIDESEEIIMLKEKNKKLLDTNENFAKKLSINYDRIDKLREVVLKLQYIVEQNELDNKEKKHEK